MTKPVVKDFKPLRFEFNANADTELYYVYSIHNRSKDKFYIGVSRHPNRRINEQLQFKSELNEDYARTAKYDANSPEHRRNFAFGLITPEGYPNALLACTAEVLNMLHLENMNISLYNKNKFGGHPSLGDARSAFEAIVIILDPAIKTLPDTKQMHSLEAHMPQIMEFVAKTEGKDIINTKVIKKLNDAWDEYLDQQKLRSFGRVTNNTPQSVIHNYHPLQREGESDQKHSEQLTTQDTIIYKYS